jgi:hypothetical protein
MNLSDVGNAIGGVLSGGLTGIIGAGIQGVLALKTKELDVQMQAAKLANDVAMKQADAAIMEQEWRARTQIAQVTAQGQEAAEDSKAFSAALTSEPQRYSDPSKVTTAQEWLMVFLDLIRGLVRPVLTIYLCAITTLIYLEAKSLIGAGIPQDQASALLSKIIDAVLYLTVSCVLFWFGTRQKSRPPKL